MIKAYNDMWAKLLRIDGKTKRMDYWLAVLGVAIVSTVLGFLAKLFLVGWIFKIILWVYGVLTTIAGVTMTIRRLHDVGLNGLWILIGLVPGIGWLALLIICFLPAR